MTAADYRAEARAWRRRARKIDVGCAACIWDDRYDRHRTLGASLHRFNAALAIEEMVELDRARASNRLPAVLFCLILALEAEDDARRAKR